MSNIEIALAAVSVVVVGISTFSAYWYRIEKRQVIDKKNAELRLRSVFGGSAVASPASYTILTREPREMVAISRIARSAQ